MTTKSDKQGDNIQLGDFVRLDGGPVYNGYSAWGEMYGMKMPSPYLIANGAHVFRLRVVGPPLDDWWGKLVIHQGHYMLAGIESVDNGCCFVVAREGLSLFEKADYVGKLGF